MSRFIKVASTIGLKKGEIYREKKIAEKSDTLRTRVFFPRPEVKNKWDYVSQFFVSLLAKQIQSYLS